MKKWLILVSLIILIFIPFEGFAQIPLPNLSLDFQQSNSPKQIALSLQLLLLVTILTLAPSIVIMVTSFIRVHIVLSFVRNALGTQTMPPNQVIVALSLFMTFFIMQPTFSKIYEEAWKPYSQNNQATQQPINSLYNKAMSPLREFMFKQIELSKDEGLRILMNFVRISGQKERPKNKQDIPNYVLIPAFMTHELTKAFKMGIFIFIPFLLIDLIISSILMAMGMIMLPPVMIALPFKIILFVLVDGWNLIITNIINGFQ